MINGIRFKICGLRRVEDTRAAAAAGADFLGFIQYPKSPRYLSLADYGRLREELPLGVPRVAVMVEPSLSELTAAQTAGFDRFQIHFNTNLPLVRVREWSELIGANRLWLAPKLPPEAAVSESLMPWADLFLLDTFQAEDFGGSGRTGDWGKFAWHRATYPGKAWVLAGGLEPDNIAAALTESGTDFVDVNSGVESEPGVKDAAKIGRLAEMLRDFAR